MDSLHRNFSRLLHLTAHQWRLAIDRRLKDNGLGMSSWLAVATIASEAEPMTQKALAQVLGLEDASVVPLINRLVRQQLVERIQPAEDRRKRLLLVTEQGRELFRKVKIEADALRSELLADIDPQELVITERVLQQLLTATGAN
ncbi:MarR family transcriptional regulator [Erwiniaceae bacterium BAC15a-03b]|uniref:MarR family transcriptional regulator n=1 Tax=Winslowiella arboricola TaxID=2978220 RepID=A0A9J6PUA8_9GAMM|nr:MarR family transcriptional regulator [Winslowiella arboricola]MCU5775341.1 MarR family transcriptional regulator [Winslowiella arboricola]MCU5780262.1 MarR family transcriptional regulator [Winslowiella arboricola]